MKNRNHQKNSKRLRSLKTYIIIVFLCASLIPLIISGVISYRKSLGESEAAAYSTRDQFLDLAGLELNALVDQVHKVYTQLSVNAELGRALAAAPRDALEALRQRRYVNKNILDDYLALNPVIRNVIVYPDNSDFAILAGQGGVSFTKGYKQFSLYRQAKAAPDIPFWQGLHEYEGAYYTSREKEILGFFQGFRRNRIFMGTIEIQLKKGYFDRILSSSNDRCGSTVMLLDAEGSLISANQAADADRTGDVLNGSSDEFDITVLQLNNRWTLVYAIPRAALVQSASVILLNTVVTSLIYFVLAVTLALLVSWLIKRPINSVIANMERPLSDETEAPGCRSRIREIAFLENSYNEMRWSTKRLIAELWEEQNKKMEAELMVLQAQISPHFLYNSLNLIRCTAELNNQSDINQMTAALISMLEFSVNSAECVSIGEEIAVAKQYVTLQVYRQRRALG